RVRRIVVTMNQVMKQARVLAVICPGLLEHSGRAHVSWNVATAVRRAEDGQTVEGSTIDVIRVVRVQPGHRLLVKEIALRLASLSGENLRGVRVFFSAIGLGLSSPLGGGWRQFVQARPPRL